MEIYNDYGYVGQDCRPNNPYGAYDCYEYCPDCNFNGTDYFSYLSPNGTDPLYFWYYRGVPHGPEANYPTTIMPDVILGNSLDVSTNGNPALGVESRCLQGAELGLYNHTRGIGFFADLIPLGRTPTSGTFIDGALEAWTNDVDGSEARMFRPRFARNEYGYLDPISDLPKKWRTYLYYNDAPWGLCISQERWRNTSWFSVSEIEITER